MISIRLRKWKEEVSWSHDLTESHIGDLAKA